LAFSIALVDVDIVKKLNDDTLHEKEKALVIWYCIEGCGYQYRKQSD